MQAYDERRRRKDEQREAEEAAAEEAAIKAEEARQVRFSLLLLLRRRGSLCHNLSADRMCTIGCPREKKRGKGAICEVFMRAASCSSCQAAINVKVQTSFVQAAEDAEAAKWLGQISVEKEGQDASDSAEQQVG